jgi:hypothetical protein
LTTKFVRILIVSFCRSVYAHVWYTIIENRGRETKDFNADFAKLKPEEVAVSPRLVSMFIC